ncbi:alpha/beta hydrolase [Actinoallomurus rhizosphaericola]|uniref:alpha/beta hydrolase n=1 Tax=Actinoallomurus rhizosphaericola TaxID=2952536 RepID=UPI0020934784|nr:alpha/beta hydrolase [Actinoallomurus rhizosphaericola]MCO5998487.1 alpha/beta hydrolase [Actinoallomurus rhizosphaericola]
MKKLVVITAAATGLVGPVVAAPVAVAAPAKAQADPPVGGVAWSPCPDDDPVLGGLLKGLECGSLKVPLDYGRPHGRQITLALTRARHTAPDAQYQGIVLLNRGQWPGGIGRDLPTRFAQGTTGLPRAIGSTYDWIGFDPRGVGASEPMVTCDPTYIDPGHAQADPMPHTAAEEQAWLDKARAYADSCGSRYGDELTYLGTKDSARDLDMIRRALGQEQLNYLGYDYGTYLGSVYASMFPNRVRRMVLDTVARPGSVWYDAGLEENVATEKRVRIFFAWIAKYDAVYHLGTTESEVEAAYDKGLAMVREAPIDGRIGPAEYSDFFSVDVYRNYSWTYHAKTLADWVLRQDPTGLRAGVGAPGYPHQNLQAMYNAVQCRDAAWPRDWKRWHNDYSRQYRQGNTFWTWRNAWINAPCAFWPVPADKPQKVGQRDVNILLVQPENDAVHSVGGAYETHRLFPNSRLILERGGDNVDASLSANGNACLNDYVSSYLRDGTRPAAEKGTDAVCQANPEPNPTAPAPSAATSATQPALL